MATTHHLNLVDRLVGYFNPRAGLQRLSARSALSQVAAYHAHESATPSRSRKFYTDRASPNTIVLQGANPLMAQARHMERNNDIARGILRTMTNNIVGANGIGVEPQPRRRDGSIHEDYAAALRTAWRDWCTAPDVSGLHTFAAVQRLVARTWLRDGECFAQELVGPVPGLTHASAVPYSLEMFEADLVPIGHDVGDRIKQGIERNAWGKPTAYYSYKGHPLETNTVSTQDLKRIPAERVIHVALRDRIGQMRGISEFASIIARLEDIKDYEDSERIAAKVAAALTAYVKKTSPDGYDSANTSTDEAGNIIPRDLRMTPGMIIDGLAVGEEIGLIDSTRPNPNVVTFRQGQLRAVAAGVGASYSSIARDYSGTYSSQRQELVEQWINYAALTDAFAGLFVRPIWASFVQYAHLSGQVQTPPDLQSGSADDALYIAQAMPWIDPLKEANALVELTKAGFTSEVAAIRKSGQNPRDVLEQIIQWRKEVARAGLVFSSDAANQNTGTPATDPQATTIADTGAAGEPQKPATHADTATDAAMAATTHAIIGLSANVATLAARDQAAPVVNVHQAPVTVNLPEAAAPQIHNHIAAPDAPVVHVAAPAVTVKNAIEPSAPVVHITNDVQPAPVTVNNAFAAKAIQTVQRDANDEIVSTTTTYQSNPE